MSAQEQAAVRAQFREQLEGQGGGRIVLRLEPEALCEEMESFRLAAFLRQKQSARIVRLYAAGSRRFAAAGILHRVQGQGRQRQQNERAAGRSVFSDCDPLMSLRLGHGDCRASAPPAA